MVLVALYVLRLLGAPPAVRVLGTGLLWLCALSAAFAPVASFARFVPTPSTFVVFADLLGRARRTTAAEPSPVVLTIELAFLLVLVAAGLALAVHAVVAVGRSAPAAGALFVATIAVPGIIVGHVPNLWQMITVAAVWLALLRRHSTIQRNRSGARPALVIATCAIVAMAAVAPALPEPEFRAHGARTIVNEVFDSGTNPMIELGKNLRRGSPYPALTYVSSGPRYLKVANLSRFEGEQWVPDRARSGRRQVEGELATPDGVAERHLSEPIRTRITIQELISSRLPVPYFVKDVTELRGAWTWDLESMTVSSERSSTRNQQYTVMSYEIDATAREMRAMDGGDRERRYRAVPRETPSVIGKTAREVASGARNNYDRALALQDFFTGGEFEYSETAPVEEGYDGTGVDVVAEFLEQRSGYCVHFASAMALMARELRIPSRIAVGFAPGSPMLGGLDRRSGFAVSSDDLHAWPELYFEGAGWVKFEPTPGRGIATRFAEPTTSAPETDPDEAAQDEGAGDEQVTEEEEIAADQGVAADDPSLRGVWFLVLLLVLAVPMAWRTMRRRTRLGPTATPEQAWDEVLDTATDLGIDIDRMRSPRTIAAKITSDGALERLRDLVERERYGRPEEPRDGDPRADAIETIAALRARASRGERFKAAVTPRSLVNR